MIGNDVIDLSVAKAESNWKRVGYLDKIFTKREQLLIANAQYPEIMVWDLWSRKEAAYKIFNRQTGTREFNPLGLECIDVNLEFGKVICEGRIYFTQTEITEQYIHSVAVVTIGDLDRISVLEDHAEINKVDGLPFLGSNHVVSLSHHGNFQRVVTLS